MGKISTAIGYIGWWIIRSAVVITGATCILVAFMVLYFALIMAEPA